MKSKIIVTLIILLILGTIYSCLRIKSLKSQVNRPITISRVDTIYVDKPFKIEDDPRAKEVAPEEIKVQPTSSTEQSVYPLTEYTPLYPGGSQIGLGITNPLVQFRVYGSTLDLSLLNTDSTVITKKFKLDLDNFKYTYNNDKLTSKRYLNIKINPYISASYRPLNNFYDLNGGISIKTGSISYHLGLNLSYYPKFSSNINPDIQLSIQYLF